MRSLVNSKIDWIGEIPTDWSLKPLQYCLYEINEKNYPVKTEQVLSLVKDKGVMLYEEKGNQGNKSKEDVSEYKLAYPNTLIVNSMNILIGSVGLSQYFGCVSPVYYVFRETDECDLRFINYLFNTREFQKELRKYANGILEIRLRVSAYDIFKRKIPLPTKKEQGIISDYLDAKCSEIDLLIDDIQNEIEKLEEYKRSITVESVTKGIRGCVSMKDSCIPYVGSIPETWDVNPAYLLFGERKNTNRFLSETNLLSLSYGKIIRKDINTTGGLLPASFSTYNIVEKDDIIIRPTDLQNDKKSLRTGLCKERGIITSAYIALKPEAEIDVRYYHYLLHAFDVMKVFYNMGNGVRQGLNFNEFSKLMVLVPPIKEQIEISDYLDAKCLEIDEISKLRSIQLDKLQDYKKALIFEYATGKKEVAVNEQYSI